MIESGLKEPQEFKIVNFCVSALALIHFMIQIVLTEDAWGYGPFVLVALMALYNANDASSMSFICLYYPVAILY